MSIDVPVDLIKAASQKLGSAADQIDPLNPETTLATLAAALPGSTSGPAASRCGTHLRLDLARWSTAADGLADRMKTSADNHVATDDASARESQRLRGDLPGGS